jgi:acyl-CoA thioesterase-1
MSCSNSEAPVTQKTTNPKPQKKEMPSAEVKKTNSKKNIIFFGNSLTAAYGLDPSQGFAGLIGARIDSLEMDYKVVNAGLSGETSAGGNSRIDWILRQEVAVFVLELGANDGLRGTPPAETYKNLNGILQKVKEKYPSAKILICAMEALPNMGEKFTSEFRAIFPKLAKENEATLIPFFLENVGGIPELNQADGIHPTAAGHKIVAENIWKVLKEVI